MENDFLKLSLNDLKTYNHKGYVVAYVPYHPNAWSGSGLVYMHRLVMENHIGRYLDSFIEIVHHKDENPLNNSIENLEIMSRADHTIIHNLYLIDIQCAGCQKVFKPRLSITKYCSSKCVLPNHKIDNIYINEIQCAICDKVFKPKLNRIKCCSHECGHRMRRKVEKPSKEILEIMVWEKPSTDIAKDFGVSDTMIKKWCRSYDINKPGRGYWMKHHAINIDTKSMF